MPSPLQNQGNEFGDLISQKITSEGDTFYHHYDALGSTAALTDSAGVVTDEYDFEAFGETAAESGATPNPYLWVARSGYRHDEETGLYDIRRRKYAADSGRFVSQDPIRRDEENLYRYVKNEPVEQADPSGLDSPGEDFTMLSSDDKQLIEQRGIRSYVRKDLDQKYAIPKPAPAGWLTCFVYGETKQDLVFKGIWVRKHRPRLGNRLGLDWDKWVPVEFGEQELGLPAMPGEKGAPSSANPRLPKVKWERRSTSAEYALIEEWDVVLEYRVNRLSTGPGEQWQSFTGYDYAYTALLKAGTETRPTTKYKETLTTIGWFGLNGTIWIPDPNTKKAVPLNELQFPDAK